MDANPRGLAPPPPQTRFSADGMWWWDGAEWKPAISPDRLWRWNGAGWEPAVAPATKSGHGVGLAIGLTAAMFIGVLVLVAIITAVVLYAVGDQILNVFSNVVEALSTPTPT